MDSVVQRRRFDNPSKKRADRSRSDPVSRGRLVPAGLLGLYRATGVQKILANRPERTGECSPPLLQWHDPGESYNPERQETASGTPNRGGTNGRTVYGTNRRRRPGRARKNDYRPGGRENIPRKRAS